MAEYQNLFTQVQIRAPSYPGVAVPPGTFNRGTSGGFSHLLGRIGDAQIGPLYLGWLGVASPASTAVTTPAVVSARGC